MKSAVDDYPFLDVEDWYEAMCDEVDRLRALRRVTHAPECLSRLPDFDARDCNCQAPA